MRELEHALERAVVMATGAELGAAALALEPPRRSTALMAVPSVATAEDVAGATGAIALPGDLTLDQAEARYARAVLARAGGNQSEAARLLGVSRNRLARLLGRT